MTKVHYVKKARKDNPAVKAGEPYWWWQFYKQKTKHYSATKPKNSQLTQSPFWQEMYDIQDEIAACSFNSHDDAVNFIDDISSRVSDLIDAAQSSLDSLPEQFQDSHMLNERVSELESMQDEIECIDTGDLETAEQEKDADPDNEEKEEAFDEALREVKAAIQDISYNGE
jgi:hypothetical protein